MNKTYKTFDEQIEILKSRNLSINNSGKLKWYLQTFNYQNFINGYNDPFMQNFTRSTNIYRDDASDLAMIDLFNFDRSLSTLLFSNIKQIESQLNTAITHEIARVLDENNYPNGNILNVINDTNIMRKIFKKDVNILTLKKSVKGKFGDKETNLWKKYKQNYKDTPIWVLSIFWSFGDIIFIFKNLRKQLKRLILEKYFNNKFDNSDALYKTLIWLKTVRNSACHNNVVYNLSTSTNSLTILSLIEKDEFNANSNQNANVKIFDVIKILDRIQNKTNKITSLETVFKDTIEKFLINKGNISNESIEFIFNAMNYKKL